MINYINIPFTIALLVALSWTVFFSMFNTKIRGLRNLGLLTSFILPIVFLFLTEFKLIIYTWLIFSILGGIIYTSYDLLQVVKAKNEDEKPQIGLSHFIPAIFAWPIMIPEAVEYSLAELGILDAKIEEVIKDVQKNTEQDDRE